MQRYTFYLKRQNVYLKIDIVSYIPYPSHDIFASISSFSIFYIKCLDIGLPR